jgi:hypothetical protein
MDMMFFNKKSELDDIRREIIEMSMHFERRDESINNRITELSVDFNTLRFGSISQIREDLLEADRRIDKINEDIKSIMNMGIVLIGLILLFICIIIGYIITH